MNDKKESVCVILFSISLLDFSMPWTYHLNTGYKRDSEHRFNLGKPPRIHDYKRKCGDYQNRYTLKHTN